ncbi:GntR family transcriptional regulator [Galbitalea soli]|uniref:GntR family transcriptional regulator n=1 Tax=Galbitalea soli TaxID=1268042 RepID=A0A7C9TSW1_9MICO|nr:GntR family transcriptional regulator [Galbitalea soli]NEM92475.1 GntR family transcriptional regulator [Galbitalea soli]NYJ29510.1 DNA-binding transcriptional regulator YhcF (GntR family) [Galbitalea soli]
MIDPASFRIDPGSSVPPFEQLREQFVERIASGELAAGIRLPTVRGLAEALGLAPGTVARSYRELEADGFIETRGRSGSFVAAQGDPRERQAKEAARVYADRIRALGVDPALGLDYARAALRD